MSSLKKACVLPVALVAFAYLLPAQVTFGPFTPYGSVQGIPPMVVADFDGDSKVDIVASDFSAAGGLHFSRGNGDGTFQVPMAVGIVHSPGVPVYIYSLIKGQFNGDTLSDLTFTGYWKTDPNSTTNNWVLGVLLSKGDGTFTLSMMKDMPGIATMLSAAPDVNGDGRSDLLFSASLSGFALNVMLGNGDGTFQPASEGLSGNGTCRPNGQVIDVNGDGFADLACRYDNARLGVLYGDGHNFTFPGIDPATNTRFTVPTFLTQSNVPVFQDLNNDQKADVVETFAGYVSTWLNLGDGSFSSEQRSETGAALNNPSKPVFGDFNGDGMVDMAVLHSYDPVHLAIYLGNGDGYFQPAIDVPSPPAAVIAADFNSDGKWDLVGASDNVTFAVAKNETVLAAPVTVTITSNKTGAPVRVDGRRYATPATFSWRPGSTHTIAAYDSPQVYASGTRALFLRWEDGSTGPVRTITVSGEATYSATFQAQYLLTLTRVGGGGLFANIVGGGPALDDYYPEGSQVTAYTSASFDHVLSRIEGDVTSTTSPVFFTMTRPMKINAVFVPIAYSYSQPMRFQTITPCRAVDTRIAPRTALQAGETVTFDLNSGDCKIYDAYAYSINVTVVPVGSLPYLTVWGASQPRPLASTLNSLDGRIKANAAVIPTNGSSLISVYAAGATHVIIDVNGSFVPGTSSDLGFYPVAPCRVLDTRNSNGPFGGPSLAPGVTRTIAMLSSNCYVPAAAKAYSLNVTAVPKGYLGYLTVWPSGVGRPVVSTLNSPTGTIVANAAFVPAGGMERAVSFYASDATDLVVDINGYFADAFENRLHGGGQNYYRTDVCRVFDTREPGSGPALTGERPFTVEGRCGMNNVSATLIGNFTAVPRSSLGYLTVWNFGPRPLASTLNALDGSITSNLAVIPNSGSAVTLFTDQTADVLFDITGFFSDHY